jgi:hypothetical protein
MGLDTKTYWLTDRQSKCDFDFDFDRLTLIRSHTRVKVGTNTTTVTMRVVGCDKKGSLKSERVNCGTRTRERLRWRGQHHIQKTDPSSHQRGRHRETRPLLSKSNKYMVMIPRRGSTPRLTD